MCSLDPMVTIMLDKNEGFNEIMKNLIEVHDVSMRDFKKRYAQKYAPHTHVSEEIP